MLRAPLLALRFYPIPAQLTGMPGAVAAEEGLLGCGKEVEASGLPLPPCSEPEVR